jgi:carbamoyltransferase|tara:strand:- start:1720 stop:3402 length:1683 start_codon:yes stop_codon:yes gene_type:complete
MNVIGLYGAIGWNVLISDNPKLSNQMNESWTHGASVTLFSDGNHIASISEERLSGIKYDGNFPRKSIEYCLSTGNLSKEDIDVVIVPSMANQNFYKNYINKTIEKKVKRYFPKAKVEIASHHLCHAYSSVFSCDYNEGSFITLDNAGSVLFDTSGQIFACENHSFGYFNKEKGIFKYYPGIPMTNNFGNYYWMWAHNIYTQMVQKKIDITDPKYRETFCGKVMGLSAYGNIKDPKKDWRLHFEGIPQVALESLPSRDFNYGNLSAENKAKQLQYNFENAMLEWMKELKEQGYIDDNLCLAGGVFLNILANSVIRKNGVAKNMHIPPFPDDTGLSFGAACYGVFKAKEKVTLPHNISLLGRTYSDEEIEEALEGMEYKKFDTFEELCGKTVNVLAENKIVGWFQNRSEFGPRALGSRSILMNPTPKENKETINTRIKHREEWRPFAGIMLEEYQDEYFMDTYPNEYMLYSLVVKPHQRKKLGAITHKDFSCRIQTVNQKLHPEVTTLLQKYNEKTECPVLLNTSFNDNGQPIVETPKDAIKTFKNIDLDYLVIGNYFVVKQ